MMKVGVTGGIGSGKSTVCKVFELLGVPVFYADAESQKLLQTDEIRHSVITLLGKSVLSETGLLDRKKIAGIVFNDPEKLKGLNAILHPAVLYHFEHWVKSHDHPYVIKEAAVLFESGANKQMDKIITVTAPENLKIERVMKRDGVSYENVQQRISNQWSDDEKTKRSQFVVHNDERNLVIPQVLAIHRQLL